MQGGDGVLLLAVFLACSVEMVEATTIVLAVGVTRGWRAALLGVGGGLLVLAAIVAVLGPAVSRVPIGALRLVVGSLLLIFGLGWLRKAILRAAGLRPRHNEQSAFRAAREQAREAARAAGGLDTYGFTVSFKGVLLEGLEVVFIVLSFGSNQGRVGLAALGAAAAVVVVLLLAVLVRAPLSRVPENTMKFAVGTLITSFGMFWGAEGAGVSWPGGDVALAVLVPFTVLSSLAMVALVRALGEQRGSARTASSAP